MKLSLLIFLLAPLASGADAPAPKTIPDDVRIAYLEAHDAYLAATLAAEQAIAQVDKTRGDLAPLTEKVQSACAPAPVVQDKKNPNHIMCGDVPAAQPAAPAAQASAPSDPAPAKPANPTPATTNAK